MAKESSPLLNLVLATKKAHKKSIVDAKSPDFEKYIDLKLPSLYKVFNGPLVRGGIYRFWGQSSSGKTALATYIAGLAQKQIPEKKILYVDAEMTFNLEQAERLGLDCTSIEHGGSLIIYQPDTLEDAFEFMLEAAKTEECSLIIFDSDMGIASKREVEQNADVAFGGSAKTISGGLRRMQAPLKKSETSLIWISQERANISSQMYGPETKATGGTSILFYLYADFRVTKDMAINKINPNQIGFKVTNKKNKRGVPFRQSSVIFDFKNGINEVTPYVEAMIELGLVDKAGAWLSSEEYGFKVQGIAKLEDWFMQPENKDTFEKLKNKVKESYSSSIRRDDDPLTEEDSEIDDLSLEKNIE